MSGKKESVIARRALARRSNLQQYGRLFRRCGLDAVLKNTRPTRPASRLDGIIFLLSSLLIASCSTGTPSSAPPQVVSVYSSFAAEPWLSALYGCAAEQNNVVLSRVDNPNAAGIGLRIGEPEFVSSFAYQIDVEEILIVTQRQSPVQNLTLDEARALFMGLGDPSVQMWVYASGEDVQQVFDQFVMEGRNVSPSANVAATPQQMSDRLVNEPNTVGILPRHWKVGDAREVFSVETVPVLALTGSEPQGVVKELIACLQK
jgi:hypothetical protein